MEFIVHLAYGREDGTALVEAPNKRAAVSRAKKLVSKSEGVFETRVVSEGVRPLSEYLEDIQETRSELLQGRESEYRYGGEVLLDWGT